MVLKRFVSHTAAAFNVERLEFLRYKIPADLMVYGRSIHSRFDTHVKAIR